MYRAGDTRLKREVAIRSFPSRLRLTQIASCDFNVGPRQLIGLYGSTVGPSAWADL